GADRCFGAPGIPVQGCVRFFGPHPGLGVSTFRDFAPPGAKGGIGGRDPVMQKGDISRPNTTRPLPRRHSGLVVAALLIVLYAAAILGLRIEELWLLILYLAAAAFLIFAYQRLTALPRWISAAIRGNAGLAAVILVVLLVLYPILLRDDPYLI